MGGMKSSLGVKVLRGITGNRQDRIADEEPKKPQGQVYARGPALPKSWKRIYEQARPKNDERVKECKRHAHACSIFVDRTLNLNLAGREMRHFRKCLSFCNYLRCSGHLGLLPEHPFLNLIIRSLAARRADAPPAKYISKDAREQESSRVLRVQSSPAIAQKGPKTRQNKTENRPQQNYLRGPGIFALGDGGRIKDFHGRHIFGFLNPGHFVSLREEFVNRLMDLGIAVKIGPLHSQQWEILDRRIGISRVLRNLAHPLS